MGVGVQLSVKHVLSRLKALGLVPSTEGRKGGRERGRGYHLDVTQEPFRTMHSKTGCHIKMGTKNPETINQWKCPS
jgi:hypothetical protein